jgi:hypothetical protein
MPFPSQHQNEKWWRIKGGVISQQRRRDNPQYYRFLGCNIAHEFQLPPYSASLAELVGIILGDGGISQSQLHITLNAVADQSYSWYVSQLMKDLFLYSPGVYHRKGQQAVVIVSSGTKLVERLQEIGLKVGNKVELQVDVPEWIKLNQAYSRWCVRGLMDTDGGIFWHRYRVNQRPYAYRKLCFSNLSQPLRRFVFQVLTDAGLHPKLQGKKHVWLYSEQEVKRYLEIIGSSNQRLVAKFT